MSDTAAPDGRPVAPGSAPTSRPVPTSRLDDAADLGGPAATSVSRRAQHERSRRSTTTGSPRVGLVSVTLSAATVAVLAAGTVQGLESDQASARASDQALVLQQAALTPDGRVEAVADRRDHAVVAARTAQERAVQQRAAEQRAAEQRVARERAAAAAKARQEAASRSSVRGGGTSPSAAKVTAQAMLAARGWSGQWTCLNALWQRESGWNYRATNPSSGAYGIPQSLPAGKLASAGSDWRTNPATQIRWGLDYIDSVYGTPCGAWSHSQSTGWY